MSLKTELKFRFHHSNFFRFYAVKFFHKFGFYLVSFSSGANVFLNNQLKKRIQARKIGCL